MGGGVLMSHGLEHPHPLATGVGGYMRSGGGGASGTVRVLAGRTGGVRKPSLSATDGWKGRSTPSRFCHICSRTAKKVALLACGNLASGACRKVVCEKCFAEYGWDWNRAAALAARGAWQCTHCRRACPRRAQCAIYRRTNERRREQQQQARARLQRMRTHGLENSPTSTLFSVPPATIAPRITPTGHE